MTRTHGGVGSDSDESSSPEDLRAYDSPFLDSSGAKYFVPLARPGGQLCLPSTSPKDAGLHTRIQEPDEEAQSETSGGTSMRKKRLREERMTFSPPNKVLILDRNDHETHVQEAIKLKMSLQEKEVELQNLRELVAELEARSTSQDPKLQDHIETERKAWRVEAELATQPLIQSLNEQAIRIVALERDNDELRREVSGQCSKGKDKAVEEQSEGKWEKAFEVVKPMVEEAFAMLKRRYQMQLSELKDKNGQLEKQVVHWKTEAEKNVHGRRKEAQDSNDPQGQELEQRIDDVEAQTKECVHLKKLKEEGSSTQSSAQQNTSDSEPGSVAGVTIFISSLSEFIHRLIR
ncbi:hypothetical protein IW262DRAFT_1461545 [Armillaria fumosa]|nr:hypothetical protein IW262DRAFT_1461545 [Armillaria fumosa]